MRLGPTLIAALALTALGVTSAHAQPKFTSSSYPQAVPAEDSGAEDIFTVSGNEVLCTGEALTGALLAASSGLSMTPHYENCKTRNAAFTNLTVTHNGCNLEFTASTTIEKDHNGGRVHVKCPEGKLIELHHYSTLSNHQAGVSACTQTLGSSTSEGSVTYTNVTGNVLIEGAFAFKDNFVVHGDCSLGFTLNLTFIYDIGITARTTSGASLHVG